MSESFLDAAEAREYHTRRAAAVDGPVFTFTLQDTDEAEWTDVWANALDGYGKTAASRLPPPPRQEQWHSCSQKGDANESALRAIEDEDVELVRNLFKTPKDLLRWRAGYFTCGCVVSFTYHESVLHVAFAALNLVILQHLYSLSPVLFMQLMGMTNMEEHMGEGATLPLLYSMSLEKLSGGPGKDRRANRLPAIMAWLCDTGLMTPTLATACFPVVGRPELPKSVTQQTLNRMIVEAVYARALLPPAALAALERWEALGLEHQCALSKAALEEA